MDLTYVVSTHLVFLVKQAMNPGWLLATEVTSMPLHPQYLAGASNMEPGPSALVSFQLRHLLSLQVLFRP